MRSVLRTVVCAGTALLLSTAAFAEERLVIGVAPHTSARVILEMYQPLREYLEKALGVAIEVTTAPDFDEYARRGLAGQYDLAITTGHQARLFQLDAKYIPLLTYKADFTALAIVAANGPIRKPEDLKGKSALGLSPTSLVTLWGEHWLSSNGLGSVPVKYVSASDSVGQLLLSGETWVGFVSLPNLQKLPKEIQDQLRILAQSPPMAGRVYVLNNRLAARKAKVEAALWAFAETPEAKKYFQTTKLDGYRKLNPGELKEMDRYAGETRKRLAQGAQ